MKEVKHIVIAIKSVLKPRPSRAFFDTFSKLLSAMKNVFVDVFFLSILLKMCEEKRPFLHVIYFIGFSMLIVLNIEGISAWYKHIYCPKTDLITKRDMDYKMLKKATSVDLACFENPDYYERYRRVQSEYFDINMGIYRSTRDLFVLTIENITIIVLMISIDPLAILFGIIPFLLVFFLGKKSKKLKVDLQKTNTTPARRAAHSERTFYMKEYAKEMRLFRIYEPIIRNYIEAVENLRKNIRQAGRHIVVVDFFRRVLSENIMYFGLLVYVLLRTLLMRDFGNVASDWLMLINSIASFTYTMQNIADKTQSLTTQVAQLDLCNEYFSYQPMISEEFVGKTMQLSKAGHIICFEHVTFTYPGQNKPVIRDLDLTIFPMQKIGIVGINGAGKSTILKLLLRLYDPDSGRITCDGIDIREYTVRDYRALFGTVLQNAKLFSLSIAENVMAGFACDSCDERVEEALEKSGFKSKLSSIPGGIHATLTKEFNEKGVVLSGGEAQKIAIARVHATNNSIVLLDEPSSSLDPVAEYEMLQTMYATCNNKSMVLVSHRLSNVVSTDCIYVIDDGRVVEHGTHDELITLDGLYAKMFHLQAEGYREEQ